MRTAVLDLRQANNPCLVLAGIEDEAPYRGISLAVTGNGKLFAQEFPHYSVEETMRVSPVKLAEQVVPQMASGRPGVPLSRAVRFFGLDGEPVNAEARGFAEAALNRKALDVLRSVNEFTFADYSYYAGAAASEPQKTAYRMQAAEVFPLLANLFPRRPMLRLAIDRGAELMPEVMKALNVNKASLRRLQGVAWPSDGTEPAELIRLLDAVPPDWAPKNEADWGLFLDVMRAATVVQDIAGGLPVDGLLDGCRGDWRRFAMAMIESAGLPDGIVDSSARREALRMAAVNVREMVADFTRLVTLPMAAYQTQDQGSHYLNDAHLEQAHIVSASILLAGKALPAILDLSRRWHMQAANIDTTVTNAIYGEAFAQAENERRELEALVAQQGEAAADAARHLAQLNERNAGQNSWPGLVVEPVQTPNGYVIVPLVTRDMLNKESERLGHCVSTYGNKSAQGDCYILSTRRADRPDVALATVEFAPLSAGQRELKERQYYGARNCPVKVDERVAMDWFKAEVAAGRIALNPDIFEHKRRRAEAQARLNQARQAAADANSRATELRRSLEVDPVTRMRAKVTWDDVASHCDYDWRDGRNLVAAFNAWARPLRSPEGNEMPAFLSKKWRGAGAKGLAESVEIMGLAEMLQPGCTCSMKMG